MGKPFPTICRELGDNILECTRHSPSSVLGQWRQQGIHNSNTAPERILGLMLGINAEMVGVVTGGTFLGRMFSHSDI